MMRTVTIGSGSGLGSDRIDPAVDLVKRVDLQYVCFDCLAERTVALAQLARLKDPRLGYDPFLHARMRAAMPLCRQRGTKIIGSMGAANPQEAASGIVRLASELGLHGIRVAVVTGDDVMDQVLANVPLLSLSGEPFAWRHRETVSANAYLGAAPIMEALSRGADIVVTGRVADPSLYVAPLAFEFGWCVDDWLRLGAATVVGHLLECCAQLSGGYYADPGYKDVERLSELGCPYATVNEDGTAVVAKTPGSGGLISVATCTEQLLYEVHDPRAYTTPDVMADFSNVRFSPHAPNTVAVSGGSGRPATDWLKVSIGYRAGFVGEGQICYGGPGAVARAKLAAAVLRERFEIVSLNATDYKFDLISVNSLFPGDSDSSTEVTEVVLRVAARCESVTDAERVGNETEALYGTGPAAGGGVRKSVREVVAVQSCLIPRANVSWRVELHTA